LKNARSALGQGTRGRHRRARVIGIRANGLKRFVGSKDCGVVRRGPSFREALDAGLEPTVR